MNTAEFRARAPLPYAEFVTLCALLMASTAFAIDIVLPAMLIIGDALGAGNENAAQWLVSAYLIPFAFGQLIFGPLADRFGRRPVVLFGIVVYTIASALSVLASDFTTLLIMRGVAGFGAASGRVAVVAIVRDCFAGRDMASVMSLVMMIFMVVPIVAPLAGQVLTEAISWHAIFSFMALFGVFLLAWIGLRLPETLDPRNRNSLGFQSLLHAFAVVVSNRSALFYALAMSIFFGSLFGFVNSAPQIYTQTYDLGVWFPAAFSLGGAFVAVASHTNSTMVQRLGMRRLSHGALLSFIGLGIVMLAVSAFFHGRPPVAVIIVGTSAMFFCFGFIGTNFNALAMEPLGAHAGMASAIFGFLQMAVAGSVGAIIGQFYNGTAIPLLVGFVCCGLMSLGCVLWAERGRLLNEA